MSSDRMSSEVMSLSFFWFMKVSKVELGRSVNVHMFLWITVMAPSCFGCISVITVEDVNEKCRKTYYWKKKKKNLQILVVSFLIGTTSDRETISYKVLYTTLKSSLIGTPPYPSSPSLAMWLVGIHPCYCLAGIMLYGSVHFLCGPKAVNKYWNFFSAHTPWGDFCWIWPKVYWIRINDC